MAKNIEIGKAELAWDAGDVPGSLAKLRQYVEEQADNASAWYLARKGTKSWFSRYMRLGVIVMTALGALLPIAAHLFKSSLSPAAADLATSSLIPALLVGLSAALLGADKAFGFSTGWIRYITTAAIIRKALEEFRIEWMLKSSQASSPPTNGQVADLVQAAKTFHLTVEGYVIDETRAWAVEFQNTLAQLEKDANEKFQQLTAQARQDAKDAKEAAEQQRARASDEAKAQSEAQRTGSIELSVPNSVAADDRTVRIQMEGEGLSFVDTVVGSPRWSRIGLKPGHYRVIVSAQASSKPITDQVVCEIKPGELLKTELKLPV